MCSGNHLTTLHALVLKKGNSEENPKKQKVDEISEKQTTSGNHKDLTCASVIMGSQVMYECSTF